MRAISMPTETLMFFPHVPTVSLILVRPHSPGRIQTDASFDAVICTL